MNLTTTEKDFNWTYTVDYAYTDSFESADEVTDTKSKEYFQNWLSEHSKCVSPWHNTPDYSHIDGAVFNYVSDTVICFELKKRNIPSTRYGDAFLTVEKYNHMKNGEEKMKKVFDDNGFTNVNIRNVLVTLYSDGVFAVWNIDDYVKESSVFMASTTEKTTGSKEMKHVPMYVYTLKNSRLVQSDPELLKIYA